MKTGGSLPKTLSKKKVGRKPKRRLASESTSDISGLDKGKIQVNGMTLDIENINDEQLYALRKVLPRKEYRYLLSNK